MAYKSIDNSELEIIKIFLKKKEITVLSLSKFCSYTRVHLSRIFSGTCSLNFNSFIKICEGIEKMDITNKELKKITNIKERIKCKYLYLQ